VHRGEVVICQHWAPSFFYSSIAHSRNHTYILMVDVYFHVVEYYTSLPTLLVSFLCLFCGLRDSAKCRLAEYKPAYCSATSIP
jgi:hypothetical protein